MERPLTTVEQRRLEKYKNRRGRKSPAKVPARLTRTSAFAPKRQNLNTDSNFERIYVVPGHSVIQVSGRELGVQHRDAIYAVFRLPTKRISERADPKSTRHGLPFFTIHSATTTWRGLLRLMNKTEHTNNLMTLLGVLTDIGKVVFTVFEGPDQDAIAKALKANNLAELQRQGKAGKQGSLIHEIKWSGLELDSEITFILGDWTGEAIERARLVSLNADVQFALKSDHAKTFWPYIDSMNTHRYVDEDVLATLAGREDLWGEYETKSSRGQFRKDCKQAFDDMVRAGGLESYRVEITGVGRKKSRRYHYKHALSYQRELPLGDGGKEIELHRASPSGTRRSA